MSEWIKFKSGVQPVLDGVKVTIKTAGGDIETGIAEGFAWELLGYDSDIVAFKTEDSSQVELIPRELSAREYAAIKLRVPDSGTDWLDAMIEKSLLNEFAGKAMQGIVTALTDTEKSAHPDTKNMVADAAYRLHKQCSKQAKGNDMHDVDRKAMLDAEERYTSNLEPSEIGYAPLDFTAGWQAACEWRDSQVGEPRYWVHNFGDEDGGEEFFDHPTGSDCPDCVPLYLAPPTAQINQQLVEALERLISAYSVSHSPEVRANCWEQAKAALAATQMRGDA